MPLAPPGPITPGLYPGPGQAALLRANEQQYLFRQNLVISGQASIAVQLERIKSSFYPFGCSLQIWFTDVNGAAADPGTFEVDAQGADVDIAAMFTDLSGGATSLNASFATRIEQPWLWAKYLRVNAKTVTNAVYLNVLVTR